MPRIDFGRERCVKSRFVCLCVLKWCKKAKIKMKKRGKIKIKIRKVIREE